MKSKLSLLFVCVLLVFAFILSAASSRPQLSVDEQDLLVQSVIQTLDPEGMKSSIAATVESDIIEKIKAGGFLGLAAALEVTPAVPASEPTALPKVAQGVLADVAMSEATTVAAADSNDSPLSKLAQGVQTDAAVSEAAAATVAITPDPNASPTPTRALDNPEAYWDGAVLQDDGTYRGLHAKYSNSYAYAVGSSDEGVTKEFKSVFVPNEVFTVDVVFENDGSVVWPARIEMRHVSHVGEYTGHTESVISDRTYNPVKPGDKCGFSVSAHGSENLGGHTFFFKLYDADSGSVIEGGDGSFYYLSE